MAQAHRSRSRFESGSDENSLESLHLSREVQTSLELAILGLAPSHLVDELATLTGLFTALAELPADSAPALALYPATVSRAKACLERWHAWEKEHLHKARA